MATKDITDAQVCRAVQDYQDAMRDCPPLGNDIFLNAVLNFFETGAPPAPSSSPPWPYEALAASTGQPEKVCYRAMERAERRGLIEYGVSLRTGWLTEAGKALLED